MGSGKTMLSAAMQTLSLGCSLHDAEFIDVGGNAVRNVPLPFRTVTVPHPAVWQPRLRHWYETRPNQRVARFSRWSSVTSMVPAVRTVSMHALDALGRTPSASVTALARTIEPSELIMYPSPPQASDLIPGCTRPTVRDAVS